MAPFPLLPPSPPRITRRGCIVAAAALALGPGARAHVRDEAAAKKRILHSLMRFARWPLEVAVGRILLVVAARDERLCAALASLDGQSVGARPVQVVLNPASIPEGCRALYVAGDAEPDAALLLEAVAQQPVLTVGDGDGFVARGMVGLVRLHDAVRFDVNLARLRAGQMSLASQALRLAREVRQ